jgi:cytoskeletal protein CcmA (bactofilin family)
MHEERGQLRGNQVISEAVDLFGSIAGNVTVENGGKVYVRGNIFGNLLVDDGGRVHIYGHVTGNLTVKEGAKVIHSGMIGGDAINRGGRLYIEASGKVLGKVRTRGGETKIDPKSTAAE